MKQIIGALTLLIIVILALTGYDFASSPEQLPSFLQSYLMQQPQRVSLEAAQQGAILAATAILTIGWIINRIKYARLVRKLTKGRYLMVKQPRGKDQLPMKQKDLEGLMEEVLADAKADMDVPNLRPRLLQRALSKVNQADIAEHSKAVVKAKILAKLQASFTKSNIATVKRQTELVNAKSELLEASHGLAYRVQHLNQQQAESSMDHEVSMAQKEYELTRWKQKRDDLEPDDPNTIDAEVIDEDQQLYEEIEYHFGRQAKREIFAQELKSKKAEELIKAKEQRLEEIEEDPDLSRVEKNRLMNEVERSFDYSLRRIYGD